MEQTLHAHHDVNAIKKEIEETINTVSISIVKERIEYWLRNSGYKKEMEKIADKYYLELLKEAGINISNKNISPITGAFRNAI